MNTVMALECDARCGRPVGRRRRMTYTIAGHDPVTGQVGLATASYSANLLGNVAAVHRGTAGTALVAAQAFSDPRVGRRAARLLAEGAGRDAVLVAVQDDPGA